MLGRVEDGPLKDALQLAEHLNQKALEELAAAQRRADELHGPARS
jgi:hypothetical protein